MRGRGFIAALALVVVTAACANTAAHEAVPPDPELIAGLGDAGRYVTFTVDEVELVVNGGGEPEAAQRLMDEIHAVLGDEDWWPLVRKVRVDVDVMLSDLEVTTGLLNHPDVDELSVRICDTIVAALPDGSSLDVQVLGDTVDGGGRLVDGTSEGYELDPGRARLARGKPPWSCREDRTGKGSMPERIESYLEQFDAAAVP